MFYVNRWLNIPSGVGLRVLIIPTGTDRPPGEATANEYYLKFGAAQSYSTINAAFAAAQAIRDAWEADLLGSVGAGNYGVPRVFTL